MEYQNYGQAVVYIILPYVVEWKFDETSGSTLYDTLNTNNLTVTGSLTLNQAGPNLYNSSDRAVTFPGSTSAYAVKTSPTGLPTGASARSIELWYKSTSSTNQTLISYGTASTRQAFGLKITYGSAGPSIGFWTYSDDGYFSTSSPISPILDGQWHNFIVTYDGNLLVTAYLDGEKIGAKNVGAVLNTVLSANGIIVGRDVHTTANPFNGQIGFIRIYNYKLNTTQVLAQYNLIPKRLFNLAQAQAYIRGSSFAQAQTEVSPIKYTFAQSVVFINNWNVFAQAEVFILTNIISGQAETFIGPRQKYSQATALIDSFIKNALASVRAQITATTIHGLAQVKIWNQRAFGQARTSILLPFYREDFELKDDVFEAQTIYLGRNTYIGPQNLNSFTQNTGEIFDPTYAGTYYKTGWIKIVVPIDTTLRIDAVGSTGNPYLIVYARTPGNFDTWNWGYSLPACGVNADTYYIEVGTSNPVDSFDNIYLRISSSDFPASSPQGIGQAQVSIYRAPQNDTQVYSQSLTYTLREQDYYNEIINNDSPLAYYKLNEDVNYFYSNGLIDSLGNRNLPYAYMHSENKPHYIEGPIWPDFRGIEFGESYAYGYSSTQGLFTGTHGWALEFWIKPNNPIFSWSIALYNYDTWENYIYIGIGDPSNIGEGEIPWYTRTPYNGNQVILSIYDYVNNDRYNYIASSPISTTDWHHVVGTLSDDGTTIKLYVDGVLKASKILNYNANIVWPEWRIDFPDYTSSNVQIDDYIIYDHELTEDRVLRHFNLINYISPDTKFIWSQSQAFTVYQDGNTYNRFNVGQAQAYSGSYSKFAQARCKIRVFNLDNYGWALYQDGATHLWGLHSANISGGSDQYYWDDDIGSAEPTYYSGSFSFTHSPVNSEYYGVSGTGRREWNNVTSKLTELRSTTWTIEEWVKSPSTSTQKGWAWSIGGYSGNYYAVGLGFGSNTSGTGNQIILSFVTGTNTTYDTGITYVPDTWYHTAVTYNYNNGNDTFSVYINGNLITTINHPSWEPSYLSYFYFGYHYYWGSPSSALGYDNLAIYPFELPQNTILSHYAFKASTNNAYASASFEISSIPPAKFNQYASAAVYPWNPTGTNKVQQYSQAASYRHFYVFGLANAKTNVYERSYHGLAKVSIIQTYPLPDYKAVVLADTPDAYWPFSDSIVTTAQEIIANKTATLAGSSTSPTPLVYNSGIGVDGVDPGWSWAGTARYLTTSYAQPSTNIAIVEAWFKTTGTGEIWQGRYNQAGDSTGRGITLTLNSSLGYGTEAGKLNFFVNSDGLVRGIKSNSLYNNNQLYHVVAAWRSSGGTALDNSQFTLYVNGTQISTTGLSTAGSATAPLAGNTNGKFAGANYGAFSGYLSNIAFYIHDLTSDQILAHYNARALPINARPYGQAQAYISFHNFANTQAIIRQTFPNQPDVAGPFGLAQAYRWPWGHAQAITQVGWGQSDYRRAVLNDKPILYYPMDYKTRNLVRFPSGGTASYSAYNYYSASYLPAYAADGNHSDGWAANGYATSPESSKRWWQVDWSQPQTIKAVRVVNRPNYTFGTGRIIFSDDTTYNVTFPATSREATVYEVDVTNVTWMKLISDSGGSNNPGFSEVEAFEFYDQDIGKLRSIVGRGSAAFNSDSTQIVDVDGAVGNTKSITFNGNTARVPPSDTYEWATGYLVMPGLVNDYNNSNVISEPFWLYSGDQVTVYITQDFVYTGDRSLGIQSYAGTNSYLRGSFTVGNSFTFTASTTGTHVVYTWANTNYLHPTGAGYFTYKKYNSDLLPSGIPITNLSCITVEGWFKWSGSDQDMIFGMDYYDLMVRTGGFIGFNTGNNGDVYGIAGISTNTWYHVAAVFYNGAYTPEFNKLYINGVEQSLAYRDGNFSRLALFGNVFNIGGWPTNTSYRWDSGLDELAIFDYELTAEQILTHYETRTRFQQISQAQAAIYVYGGSGDPPYPRNQMYAGAFAHINLYFQMAQAQARIIGTYYLGSQALTLTTTPGQGLMRMIWNGGAYAIENIFNWNIEDGANQPNYSTGVPIPYFPGADSGAAWSARFTADEEGLWHFQVYSDDNSELWINNTRVVANNNGGDHSGSFFEGGHSPNTEDNSIYLYDGVEYNLHLRFGNLPNASWNLTAWYKRPTDSDWKYLTDGSPPWLDAPKTRKYSQAQTEIVPQPRRNQWAQAETSIIRITKVHAQARVRISWQHYSQANARIIAFNVNAYGQARVVAGHIHHANAQAKLNSFDYPQWGQTQANIYKSAGYGLARARITKIEYCIGYAVAIILGATGKGSTQAAIKQTYPLMSMDVNYALLSEGATAFDTVPQQDIPNLAIDGDNLYTAWTIAGLVALNHSLIVNLGQNRTVNFLSILPWQYNGIVSVDYLTGNYNEDDQYNTWVNVNIINFDVSYFQPIDSSKEVRFAIPPVTARYWRIKLTEFGDYYGISIVSFNIGWATVKSPTFAQAQASFGRWVSGQALFYISPGKGWQWGQARTSIVTTYQVYAQSNAYYIPPTTFGIANSNILQTYLVYANANCMYIPPTYHGIAQARIIRFNIPQIGFAQANILHTYFKFAQAKATIWKRTGFGQALCLTRNFGYKVYGLARVAISSHKYASVAAYIKKSGGTAHTTALIREHNINRYAQARTSIKFPSMGLAQANILQTYEKAGQAGSLLNTGLKTASAQANVERTYEKFSQAQANIKQTYHTSSQALTVVTIRYRVDGQAQAVVQIQRTKISQAMVWIGYHKFSQAQAQVLSFNVPKFGIANGYIKVGSDVVVPPIGPSSEYYTYLVRYNNQDLPGYAQTESFDSVMGITVHNAPYMDASLSEYVGLKNKVISLKMLLWENTYGECKLKLQRAGTILRFSRGFSKLYIQHSDKHYLAIPRSLVASKAVPESPRTLAYDIEWEAKPWLISDVTNSITTGTTSTVGRTYEDGGWTPTIVNVTGTNVSITGTAAGQSVGTITLSGTVSNLTVDTEQFTVVDINNINRADVINKDFSLYVGPGVTTFDISGATDYTIQWHNRWYI